MRAAIYTRYSTDKQTENSTAFQIKSCADFCLQKGYKIVKVYSDEETTGTNVQRLQFQNMLNDAATNLFDCVVIYDVSRGSRDVVDWFNLRKHLRQLNIRFESVHENLGDLYDPNSFLQELITIGIGEHQVLQSRQKSIDGKMVRANKGLFMGGYAPFGYKVNKNGEYEIEPSEENIVKEIFEKYINGESYQNIISYVNKQGFLTRKNHKFTKTTIYGILKNIRYTGTYKYNEILRREMHHKINKKNPDEKIIVKENCIPAIISKDTYDVAQMLLCKRKETAKRNHKHTYSLSNKIYCGVCGANYFGRTSKNKSGVVSRRYLCTNKYANKSCNNINVSLPVLESGVAKVVRNFLQNLELDKLEDIMFANKTKIHSSSKEEKRLEEVERQHKNIVDGIKNGIFYNGIQSDIDRLELESKTLKQTIELKKAYQLSDAAKKIELKKYLYEEIKNLCNCNDSDLIDKFVKKICIYPDNTCDIEIVAHSTGSPGEHIVLCTLHCVFLYNQGKQFAMKLR